jgi:hypothetical protein
LVSFVHAIKIVRIDTIIRTNGDGDGDGDGDDDNAGYGDGYGDGDGKDRMLLSLLRRKRPRMLMANTRNPPSASIDMIVCGMSKGCHRIFSGV